MSGGHSRQKLDLTGQRYGCLTVLGSAENVGSRTAWRCLCDCGQETVVKTHHLRCGHTKTCGCQNGPGGPRPALGLTYIDGTCVEILRTNTIRSNNTSGVPGVDWVASKRLWRAAICFKGKRHYLGCYHKFEDAVKARKQAEEELFDPFLREFAQSTEEAAEG
ncbi:MAG: HNH endonuclease [Clostridiales bacterium]|nr:HNH endonuclease [Clostridiales bacterium]